MPNSEQENGIQSHQININAPVHRHHCIIVIIGIIIISNNNNNSNHTIIVVIINVSVRKESNVKI